MKKKSCKSDFNEKFNDVAVIDFISFEKAESIINESFKSMVSNLSIKQFFFLCKHIWTICLLFLNFISYFVCERNFYFLDETITFKNRIRNKKNKKIGEDVLFSKQLKLEN